MKKLTLLENIKIIALAVVAIGVMALAGCNKDGDEGPNQNILEIVQNTEGLDSLAKYLELFPDLAASLSAEGSLTLFVPTNTAFINLLDVEGFPPNITQINPEIIANVLAYHVVASKYNASDLTAGTEIPTQSFGNEKIIINTDGTLKTGSDLNPNIVVISADIEATNGVIHTVGSVLIPPSMAGLSQVLPTTYGPISLSANFTILAQAIKKADIYAAGSGGELTPLAGILTGSTFHTVFAPSDATFNGADPAITVDTYTGAQWYGIIANHVIMQDVTAATLTSADAISPGLEYSSAAGFGIYMFYAAGNATNGIGVFIDSDGNQAPNAEVAVPDTALPDLLSKTNGRIHIIAGVMAPPAPQ